MIAALPRHRLAALAVLALVLPLLQAVGASAAHFADQVELSGEGNVAASVAWSLHTFPEGAESALIARDDVFADSLASGGAQTAQPLLLTMGETLSAEVATELERLEVVSVTILGGTGAVSEDVEAQLEDAGYEVERVAGANRFETATAIAARFLPDATTAILARASAEGDDPTREFADSLAAGGWAAAANWPVLLTETPELHAVTEAYLAEAGIGTVFIVGGTAAVSAGVQAQLEAGGITVTRVSGPNRFDTAVQVAKQRGFDTAEMAGSVILTDGQSGDGWGSGFAGAALSGMADAPVLLSNQGELPPATAEFLSGAGSGLVCSPTANGTACDAAAEALGLPSAGAVIALEGTSVNRWGDLIGSVGDPALAERLTMSGCGYEDHQVYVNPNDGEFRVMVGEPEGICTLELRLRTTEGGENALSEDITVGAPAQAGGSIPRPTMQRAHPYLITDEGVVFRFVYSRQILTSPIEFKAFKLWHHNGEPPEDQDLATFVRKDPRNPFAVEATFPPAAVEFATLVTADAGAVVDADNRGSLIGSMGVRSVALRSAETAAPDLVSIDGHDPAAQSVVFTFDEEVALNSERREEIGLAQLIMLDGSIKESDPEGLTVLPDAHSVRVSFGLDGLGAEEWTNVRRGIMRQDAVEGVESGLPNTPVAVLIAGGGRTEGPDFIGFESVNVTDTNVTFTVIFDRPVQAYDGNDDPRKTSFRMVLVDGTIVSSEAGANTHRLSDDHRKVQVQFVKAGVVRDDIRFWSVVDEAVFAVIDGKPARADTHTETVDTVIEPGTTSAPNLTQIRITHQRGATDGLHDGYTTVPTTKVQFSYDEAVVDATTLGWAGSFFLYKGKPDDPDGCKELTPAKAEQTETPIFPVDAFCMELKLIVGGNPPSLNWSACPTNNDDGTTACITKDDSSITFRVPSCDEANGNDTPLGSTDDCDNSRHNAYKWIAGTDSESSPALGAVPGGQFTGAVSGLTNTPGAMVLDF